MPPIVTLTTDFGLSDHYVGVMKGVILSICPQARIVDLSHQVTPFAIAEGAYLIAQAYRHFPKKTVHVVVVDPGVGTARRPILVEAAGQFFVSPDNGVLSMVYSREKHKVRVLTNERYFRKPVSQTFHGRDMFSPVGAHLAAGVAVARLGKRIEDYQKSGFGPPQPLGQAGGPAASSTSTGSETSSPTSLPLSFPLSRARSSPWPWARVRSACWRGTTRRERPASCL